MVPCAPGAIPSSTRARTAAPPCRGPMLPGVHQLLRQMCYSGETHWSAATWLTQYSAQTQWTDVLLVIQSLWEEQSNYLQFHSSLWPDWPDRVSSHCFLLQWREHPAERHQWQLEHLYILGILLRVPLLAGLAAGADDGNPPGGHGCNSGCHHRSSKVLLAAKHLSNIISIQATATDEAAANCMNSNIWRCWSYCSIEVINFQ